MNPGVLVRREVKFIFTTAVIAVAGFWMLSFLSIGVSMIFGPVAGKGVYFSGYAFVAGAVFGWLWLRLD